MSYNLLFNTNFNSKEINHWKLTNCTFKNGYLISSDKIFSIEQEIVLPDPTKLYFSMDYICSDKNITSIYCGIQTGKVLEANKKKPRINRRKRISVVDQVETEKIKVIFICESKTDNAKIYIDSPLLIDINRQGKDWWPKYVLNKCLDFRYGYDYYNLYKYGSEINIDNPDFSSPYTKTEQANIGILATITENDWFRVSHNFEEDHYYLLKLDYEQINTYGNIYVLYGDVSSKDLDRDQLYIIFKANSRDEIRVKLDNGEQLPYLVNLKHILLIDLTNLKIEEDDIKHLPFV